jgi:hypothetical protein
LAILGRDRLCIVMVSDQRRLFCRPFAEATAPNAAMALTSRTTFVAGTLRRSIVAVETGGSQRHIAAPLPVAVIAPHDARSVWVTSDGKPSIVVQQLTTAGALHDVGLPFAVSSGSLAAAGSRGELVIADGYWRVVVFLRP